MFADPSWNPGRDLAWRTTHRRQAALRRARMKYLRVDGHEYLFDVVADPRERANLAMRRPDVLASLREAWAAWDGTLPAVPRDAQVLLGFTEADLPRPTHRGPRIAARRARHRRAARHQRPPGNGHRSRSRRRG
ncbi:MAG: hypothetical protein U1F67_20215 [Rubrivivax sp.]